MNNKIIMNNKIDNNIYIINDNKLKFFYIKYSNDFYEIEYNNYIYYYFKLIDILSKYNNNDNKNLQIINYKPKYIDKRIYLDSITEYPLYNNDNINYILIIIKYIPDKKIKKSIINILKKYLNELLYIIIRVLDYDNFYSSTNFKKHKYYYHNQCDNFLNQRLFNSKIYDYRDNISIYEKIYTDIVDSNIYKTYNDLYNIVDIIYNIILYCDNNNITILDYINNRLVSINNYIDNMSYLNFNYSDFYNNINFFDYNINNINIFNDDDDIYILINNILFDIKLFINKI
jgi:hypothetical protein